MSQKFVRHYVIAPFPEGNKWFSFNITKQKFAVVRREPCADWNNQKYGELFLLKSGGWDTNPYCTWIGAAQPFDKKIAHTIVDSLNEQLPTKGRAYE
jgi:hypothetical protein